MSYQKIIIAGNLGRDPELRYTPAGEAVTRLNVATSRKWAGKNGEQQEETIWFNVSVWGKRAEVCAKWLTKGKQVIIEGRLSPDRATGEPRIYQDKQGNYRSSYEMTAQEVRFLGGGTGDNDSSFKNQQEPTSSYQSTPAPQMDNEPLSEDEIPF